MQYLVTYLRLSEYDMPRADHVEKINWIEQWERDREREIERRIIQVSDTFSLPCCVSSISCFTFWNILFGYVVL